MKKTARTLSLIVGIIVGLYLLILLGLQLFINSRKVHSMVEDVAEEVTNAKLSFSRLRFDAFGSFPCFKISIQDASLTYPHSRFSEWDRGLQGTLFEFGYGTECDTLVSFSKFTLALNPYSLLSKKIRLRHADINGLRLYAHAYPVNGTDTTLSANWQIFSSSKKTDDANNPEVIASNTAPTPTTLAEGSTKQAQKPLSLPNVKLGRVNLSGQPIIVYTSLKDTLCAYLTIDNFSIKSPKANAFDLNSDMLFQAWTPALSHMQVPLRLNALLSYQNTGDTTLVEASRLNANIAQIPLVAKVSTKLLPESTFVDASLDVEDCNVTKSIACISADLLPSFVKSMPTKLNLSATAQGYLQKDGPEPLGVNIRNLEASAPGAKMRLSAKINNLLSKDPLLSTHLKGDANLSTLSQSILPDSLRLSGLLNLSLDGHTKLSELKDFKFNNGAISAQANSDDISFASPSDSLYLGLKGTKIELASNRNGLSALLQMDTLSFAKDKNTVARIRQMSNRASLTKVPYRETFVSKISFESNAGRVFLRLDDKRLGTKNLNLTASLQKRVRRHRTHRPGERPDAARFTGVRKREPSVQDDFKDKNIHIDLGENAVKFLKEWSPSASLVAGRSYFITPQLPLRNRINAIDLQYNDDSFNLNKLELLSGSSDISFNGRITGLRRTLQGKGFLRGDLSASSQCLNLNELLSAYEKGKDKTYVPLSENDESFVTDTLCNVEYEHSGEMRAFVVPANLNASVNLHVSKLLYSDLTITPFDATINASKRCVQLTNTHLNTNLGKVEFDAFYATRSKDDIKIGADLQLIDMPAANIIHMLPTVDTMVPALKSFEGNFGCRISLASQLDTNLNVLFPSLNALLKITGHDLKISDAGKFRTITSLLLFKDKNIGHIDDLQVDAVVENNQIEIYPFILGVDKYKLGFMGVQGLNKAMRYNVSIIKAPLFPIPFGINVFGTLDDFRFSIGRSKYRKGKVPVFTRELDDMHYNIGDAIKNVFEKGVEGALAASAQGCSNLKKRKEELGYDNSLPFDFLSNAEYQQFEAAMFEEEMKAYDEQVAKEVEAALAESFKI